MTAEVLPLTKVNGADHAVVDEVAIWLDPPRFWSATENMSEEEVSSLLNEVMSLAERRDLSALRRYDFISLHRRPPLSED